MGDPSMPASLSIGLVHWPVLDRAGSVVATNVTNFDIHDMARAARTFGVERYYIIHKSQEQLMFVSRVLDHWRVGSGARFNPMRRTALDMVRPIETVHQALRDWPERPLVVATAARDHLKQKPKVSFQALREHLQNNSRPVFLLFGTGWGLHDEVIEQADLLLEPIRGGSEDDYRHLSVRSAASICLDRLKGAW